MRNCFFILGLFSLFLLACENDDNFRNEELIDDVATRPVTPSREEGIILQNTNWTNQIFELYVHNREKVSIKQGFYGTLTQREGDFMNDEIEGKEFPVNRLIHIYEYTTFSEVIEEERYTPFYTEVETKLIATIECGEEGFYEFELSPGKYSLFIVENNSLYANSGDSYGGLNSVEVEANKISERNLEINYALD